MSASLHELIALPRETEWLEFKVNDTEPQANGQNISALANAAALVGKPTAYVAWGVRDNDEGSAKAAARGRVDAALVALAFCAGLRRSEIVRQLQEHARAIDQLKERLATLPDESISQADIETYREDLEKVKAELFERLEQEVDDTKQLKPRSTISLEISIFSKRRSTP